MSSDCCYRNVKYRNQDLKKKDIEGGKNHGILHKC